MSRAAYLVLENGTVFEGKSFGAEKETTGELVFTTAMTGYLETLTDPSYFGQVVLQTFPLTMVILSENGVKLLPIFVARAILTPF